ncbi:MAG: hypothetical protein JWP51_2761 [Bradyrhizobium sp.]|nr:hypothetical protein [Bradyrhizobium sp.]
METAIKEAQTLIGSLGTYSRLVIVGVWFPGFLILCEVSYVYFRLFGPSDRGPFNFAADKMKEYDSAVISTFIVIFILAVSITFGYLARDISFAISDAWLRRRWPPTRALPVIFEQIRLLYGDEQVDGITRHHPVFRLAYGELDGSRLARSPESCVREYCKQWLRLKAPILNTEGLEIETNMVMGLVLPVAFAAAVFPLMNKNVLGVGLAIASLLAAIFMMYRITWARNIETEQAIVNFLFAHWEGPLTVAPAPPTD